MKARVQQVIESLKESKAKGLGLPAAKQVLEERGFSEAEINIAVSQHAYHNPVGLPPQEAKAQAVLATAKARERTKEHARNQIAQGFFGMLFGGLLGQYFAGRATRAYADLKDLNENKPLSSYTATKQNHKPGQRVYERNRLVRYHAWGTVIALIIMTPYALGTLGGIFIANLFYALMSFWVVVALLAGVGSALALFIATKERTIRLTIYTVAGAMALLFVALAIIAGSPVFLLGVVAVLAELLISYRVGLLSRL